MLIGTDIDFAAQAIRDGKLVVFPTETVYGLGANTFDALAVARVFEMKKRPSFDPLIVHISSIDQLDRLFQSPIDPQIYQLAEAFWPGPLTIVYNKRPEVPDLVTSGLSTVAVRMPSHPIALELIKKAGTPVAAPSANRFGCLSPTQASHVIKQGLKPDYLLEGGSTNLGIESTVVSVSEQGVRILRFGAITEESLAEHVKIITENKDENNQLLHSPGMLKSHYSPQKPLYLLDETAYKKLPIGAGLIVSSALRVNLHPTIKTLALSVKGDLNEMAVNLFAVLHAMEDDPDVAQIYIEAVSEIGIGKAIMDRVRKAAYSYSKTDLSE
jgi:L-threonylcarbamoyladenylate synthase